MKKYETRERTVHMREDSPRRGKVWAYGYHELGELLHLSPFTVRNMASAGEIDCGDLKDIVRLYLERRHKIEHDESDDDA